MALASVDFVTRDLVFGHGDKSPVHTFEASNDACRQTLASGASQYVGVELRANVIAWHRPMMVLGNSAKMMGSRGTFSSVSVV